MLHWINHGRAGRKKMVIGSEEKCLTEGAAGGVVGGRHGEEQLGMMAMLWTVMRLCGNKMEMGEAAVLQWAMVAGDVKDGGCHGWMHGRWWLMGGRRGNRRWRSVEGGSGDGRRSGKVLGTSTAVARSGKRSDHGDRASQADGGQNMADDGRAEAVSGSTSRDRRWTSDRRCRSGTQSATSLDREA